MGQISEVGPGTRHPRAGAFPHPGGPARGGRSCQGLRRYCAETCSECGHRDRYIGNTEKWVSRAAYKLLGAIEESEPPWTGAYLMQGVDRGIPTQVALVQGERNWSTQSTLGTISSPIRSRSDPRVRVREGLNLRDLPWPIWMRSVSTRRGQGRLFHLTHASAAIAPQGSSPHRNCASPSEATVRGGKNVSERSGVVRDSRLREETVDAVVEAAGDLGWVCDWRGPSRLPGAGGNQEFFIRLCSVRGAHYP